MVVVREEKIDMWEIFQRCNQQDQESDMLETKCKTELIIMTEISSWEDSGTI